MNDVIRSGEDIALEINQIKKETAVTCLQSAISIGRLLVEAKKTVSYGSWGDWLKENVDYSVSTANNLMKLYNTYGDKAKISFDENIADVFSSLTPSQALVLSALPEETRVEYVQNNDVENESVRELQKKIDELLGKNKKNEEIIAHLRSCKKKSAEKTKSLSDKLKSVEAELKASEQRVVKANADCKASEKMAAEAKKKLEEMKTIESEDNVDAEKLRAEYETQISDYKAKLVKALSAETQRFSIHFELFQNEFNSLKDMLSSMEDKETSSKLRSALLDAFEIFKGVLNED